MMGRLVQWTASSLQDLQHGIVLLRRDSGVSSLIVMVLALGIGGNAAIFTLLKAAFLDPLPYQEGERLVTVIGSVPDKRVPSGVISYNPSVSEFLEIRERSRVLENLAFLDHRDFQLTGTDEPVRVVAGRVTASFFPLLGVQASLGRTFSTDENGSGRNHVVLVSNNFWKARMGADPRAVGRTLRLNGQPSVVVGVLPPGFTFGYPSLGLSEPAEIYVPFPIAASNILQSGLDGRVDAVRVLARLRAGARQEQASAELAAIAAALYPPEKLVAGGPREWSFQVLLLREAIVGNQRSLLWLLLGGVAVLLLIACANTAQLLLARALRRGREVAIRAALGASRTRLIRQFLTEGIVLAACGGIIGVLLSDWMARLLVASLPVRSPILESVHLDMRVLAFTLSLSIISSIFFAIVPAIKGSVWTLGPGLTTRVAIGQGNRWRHVMVAVEAALSILLLCGAGLIGQNLWVLISTPAGFDPAQVLMLQLRLPSQREQTSVTYQEYLEKIAAIPGVDAAAVATAIPLRPFRGGFIRMVGEPPEILSNRRPTWGYFVSPDYFRTLGIPLVAGRTFRDDDAVGRPRVGIVNQEFVRSHGISPDAIGRQIDDGPDGRITIVGVVGDVRVRGMLTSPEPQFYTSYLQFFQPSVYLLVRSSLAQDQLVSRVKEAIRSSYSEQPIFNVTTMDRVFSASIATPRFNAFLIGAFALLALGMAASGMYSVISCLVSQRTSEIALRIALGAGRAAIVKTVVVTTTIWVLGGLAGGLGLALAAGRTIRTLSGSAVSASAFMYIAVVFFFLAVTLLAACMPLRRALRLDPAKALRGEL
jgi:putative ABC transport system permease protein